MQGRRVHAASRKSPDSIIPSLHQSSQSSSRAASPAGVPHRSDGTEQVQHSLTAHGPDVPNTNIRSNRTLYPSNEFLQPSLGFWGGLLRSCGTRTSRQKRVGIFSWNRVSDVPNTSVQTLDDDAVLGDTNGLHLLMSNFWSASRLLAISNSSLNFLLFSSADAFCEAWSWLLLRNG